MGMVDEVCCSSERGDAATYEVRVGLVCIGGNEATAVLGGSRVRHECV